ncbi:putative carboxylesterase 18 [Dorcoceras hygrometricum]|nr:putative carboxylesterase 18 [Dorcoceras hygrometricum]
MRKLNQQLRISALAHNSLQKGYRMKELLKRGPTLPQTYQTVAGNDGKCRRNATVNKMVAMYEARVASGLNGFLGCRSDISETALIEFYQNASLMSNVEQEADNSKRNSEESDVVLKNQQMVRVQQMATVEWIQQKRKDKDSADDM